MSVTVVNLGMDQVLKINNVTCGNVVDVSLTRTTDEIDVTTRGNNGMHSIQPGLRTYELSFKMYEIENDAAISYLDAAWEASTLANRLVDAQIDNFRGYWALTQYNRSENLSEAVSFDVTLKLVEKITT